MQAPAARLEILAPLSGVLIPLESVPDPVFAQKMVGDGISLDPTSGELFAPVSGVVTQLHQAHHALTITTAEGIEVLVHIGIDTVLLKGEGFKPAVKQGDQITAGQLLISFDVDLVARKARSLLTQILIANVEKVMRFVPANGLVEAGKSVALTIEIAADSSAAVQTGTHTALTGEAVSLPNPSGLHARPAAVLAAEAKKYKSDLRLVRGSDEANAKSVVAIMGLATREGDAIAIRATGPDAAEAIRTLSALLASGCGEAASEAPSAETTAPAPVRAKPASANELAESLGLAWPCGRQDRPVPPADHRGQRARRIRDNRAHQARRRVARSPQPDRNAEGTPDRPGQGPDPGRAPGAARRPRSRRPGDRRPR